MTDLTKHIGNHKILRDFFLVMAGSLALMIFFAWFNANVLLEFFADSLGGGTTLVLWLVILAVAIE